MADWSPVIANEFIRRAASEGKSFTQMQLQKLVYIANGWNLAISGVPLTQDEPQAWDYGPVYPYLWKALRSYGREGVKRPIRKTEPVCVSVTILPSAMACHVVPREPTR